MCDILSKIWNACKMWKMGQSALGSRTSKCHKENVWYFSGDVEGPPIVENGSRGFRAQELANVTKRMSAISLRIWRGPRGLEPNANVIKRTYDISIRIWRDPSLWKMGREALGRRIIKCHKEHMWYYNEDLGGGKIVENGPRALGPRSG